MAETLVNQEIEVMLPEAVKEVVILYSQYKINELTKSQKYKHINNQWKKTAEKFPPFKNNINLLRTKLKDVKDTKPMCPIDEFRLIFEEVENIPAVSLLTDVLIARISMGLGYVDSKKDPNKEANAMVTEIGIEGGLGNKEQMKGLTLNKIIESVLAGDLKLNS